MASDKEPTVIKKYANRRLYHTGTSSYVTLEDLAKEFHLSTPYISKFIREKSGKTFGEQVTQVRMKRAKTLLRNGNMTIENISYSIGYPNAEHFSRVFKKTFDVSPAQYRKITTK